MSDLRFTLLSDGSSDQALIPILRWLLGRQVVDRPVQASWADLRQLPRPPRDLAGRIKMAIDLYPSELLFIHRDAERRSFADRKAEIVTALSSLGREPSNEVRAVCVVPVKMAEAWLLFDESAIRRAAGNPLGSELLRLPRLKDLEKLEDPKGELYGLLREASGLPSRRRRRFAVQTGARRVGEMIEDFSPLLTLSAFRELDRDVQGVLNMDST